MTTKDAVILITGASRGLGRSIAVHCARQGYSVAVNFNTDENAAKKSVALCERSRVNDGQVFRAIKANVATAEGRGALIQQVRESFGRIDALVNNAGIAPRERKDITGTSLDSFMEVLDVNLVAPFFLSQRVANYWIVEKPSPLLADGFKIVNISSVSAEMASPSRAEYCISKSGLSMVTKLWALRLAEAGISVYELRPGIMSTDMTKNVREKYDALITGGLVPQERWGTPEDVGKAVVAVLNGALPFSTGAVIHVDGGLHVQQL